MCGRDMGAMGIKSGEYLSLGELDKVDCQSSSRLLYLWDLVMVHGTSDWRGMMRLVVRWLVPR